MRIGLLTNYLALSPDADSGIGLHYRVLADALAAKGHLVHVIHPTLKPEAAQTAFDLLSPLWTCDIVPVRTPRWLDRVLMSSWPARVFLAQLCATLAAAPVVASAVRKYELEIIETHATATPALAYLARSRRVPVVVRLSTTASQLNAASLVFSRINNWQAKLERISARYADALLTHTRAHRDVICALDGYSLASFSIIPHGLPDLTDISILTKTSPVNNRPEILYVGRFENRKGIDVLLDAIPSVIASDPNIQFTLAGSLSDGVLWQSFCARHPNLAGSSVVALGPVSSIQLNELYARCDILVAPSRYESFGLIYLEAMRQAKPVIGCRVGGIPEVVTEGVTGLLCAPNDVEGLVDCLQRLLADPELRTHLGQAGREAFVRRFSAEHMANSSVQFYRDVVAARNMPVL